MAAMWVCRTGTCGELVRVYFAQTAGAVTAPAVQSTQGHTVAGGGGAVA